MMKHKIKYVIALAFMLLLSQGTWADPAVTIIKQLNGEAVTTTSSGEVTSEIENSKCTLTVTPAYGYYVTSEYITAYSVVTGNVAQAPQRRSPNMDNDPITVTAIGNQSDPSGVTQYELTMPADGSDVEVTVNFQTAVMYDIYIGGVQVSQFNAADVLKDGHVSFDVESNTLTLNGATVATESGNGIDSYIDELTIHLVGNSTMNHQIWMSNGTKKLKFTTSDETPGKLAFASDVTNPYEASGVSSWSNATYQNGLTLRRNADNAYIIALDMPTPKLANSTGKVFFPGATFALAIESDNAADFDIYYRIGTGEATKYTEPFTIEGTSNATIYAYSIYRQYATDADYKSNTHSFLIRRVDKPTFTPAGGTYDEEQAVKLENLPDNLSANTYPQVWYYLGENETDSVQVTSAEQVIPVTESTKVCVYFIDEDSGKVYKSEAVQAEYTIRQDAGLAFSAQTATYTLGGENNPDMPALQNENELDVTYESSDEDVATVDAETGEVTPVGVGITTITASSLQTATLQAGEASYMLTVKKNLAHESITVTVDDAIFTGEALEPEVTVMDGETDITEYVNVTYSNNVEPGEATVTITPNTQLETNFYVGETTQTFNISYRTLEIGKDVTFASGQTWASYYNVEESLNLPEGYMAYIVTAVSETAATVKAINYIPVDVPVFIEKDATVTTTENSSAEGNLLVGMTESTPVSSIPGVVYGLHNNKLMRVTSGSIPAWRAFIAPDYEGAVARELAIVFGDSTNGINGLTVNTDDDTANDSWYTLDGRRLQQKPAKKGLYIKNGQKFLVK